MINLKEFKQSVLQKAMEGKLTKQLPNDGNANDLLVKITNYKRDLVQAGKLKDHLKPLPPITNNEVPFKIPDNWEWIRFSSLYKMVGGSQPPKSHFVTHKKNNYVRLYQTRDYGSNPKPVYIPKDEARKTTKQDDILVARYGGSLGKIFKAHNGAYNVALAKVTPITNTSELNIDYVWYYLKSSFYSSFVNSLSKLAQAGFNKHDLLKLIIPVPPLSEQQRIVSKVHKCFLLADMIQKERDLHHKFAHDMKQSLLLEAMKGQLTQQLPSDGNSYSLLKDIDKTKYKLLKSKQIRNCKLTSINKNNVPFKVPNNWLWVRLGRISFLNAGKNLNKYSSHINKNNKSVKYIKVADMNLSGNEIEIVRSKLYINSKKYILPTPSIIFPKIGGAIKTNKRRKVLTHNIFIDPNIMAITPINKDMFKFLWVFMNNIDLSQLQSGSAVPALNQQKINNILFPLPPLPEQRRIVSKLHDLFNTINFK